MNIIYKNRNLARLIFICVFLLLLFFVMAYSPVMSRQIIRIKDGKTTSFYEMVEELSDAKAIFIGEHHDNPAHHKTQLDVIRALHEKDRDLAIAVEMFKKEDQESLDKWYKREIEEKDFIPIFLKNWGFRWELYRDIFLYAREHNIPVIGLNVPWEITMKVGKTGFLSLSDEEMKELPPGVTCELDKQYMDHLVRVFQYKKSNDKSFVYFCEAQVLWDQAMAWYLTKYIKENPGKTVIILSGSIHAWKYGIPKYNLRYISVEQKVIVPDLPVDLQLINENDADYFVIHS